MATKKPNTNGKHPPAMAATDTSDDGVINYGVNYDKAVTEAKIILKRADDGWWRLGELARKVEPRYGDRTVAKFAEAIGFAACTLKRYLSVYAAWEGQIEAPGPFSTYSYAVLRELQGLDNRLEIVRENPNLTKAEAVEIRRQHEGKGDGKDKSEDWQKKQSAKCFKKLASLVHEINELEDLQAFLEFAEPKLRPVFQKAGEALLAFAEQLKPDEDYLATPSEDEEIKPDEDGIATPSEELPPRRTPDQTVSAAV
jgi:hypothetical protein